jgi:hypothetical protein
MSIKTKTIEINPALFNISGFKNKKTLTKKNKPHIAPLISPNVLKNKLLNRIKEHKKRETENLDKKKTEAKQLQPTNGGAKESKPSDTFDTYTNEFNDSIEYLQTLSNKKKTDNEKVNFERKKEEIQRKTIKNHNSMPHVNLELPDSLKEPLVNIVTEQFKPSYPDVPYGILKGGNKPTYRQWNKTLRNTESSNQSIFTNNTINTERENRLNLLKNKIKQTHSLINTAPIAPIIEVKTQPMEKSIKPNTDNSDNIDNIDNIMMTQNLIQRPKNIDESSSSNGMNESQKIYNESNLANVGNLNNVNNNLTQQNAGNLEENIPYKKIIKKTTHRKYTLGKSKIKHSVAILIKDRHTRKKVLTAQRDLKKQSIVDIKTYLRNHNLIKIGSNAPNDVLRKIYESSMLSGEITNNNKDTLLHNFIKEDGGL